ncbi:hypothetical protein [Natronorubrum texcoconense]|uniref:Uncharacterized protein n=1 Tax=Natronorubrum texcoconense TaxID=1095776 RepID=A0A1G9BTL2_9EURY|nr:hypothetical protein [Natronorubrum texcoconense]SDK42801.1 hypothetical protein SAMN04515672_3084 [Natronorubrum texcoconense]
MEREDGVAHAPRTGARGLWDRLVGPESTRAENGLILGYSVVFCTGLLLYTTIAQPDWTPLQRGVVVLVAFDIAGGIVANTTVSGTRWWHRPAQTRRDHLRFVAGHLHPFVLAWLFVGLTWADAAVIYGFLVCGAAVILATPDDLERPVAMGVFSVGLLVALYVVAVPNGLEWFVPFLYLKLLPGHLVDGRRDRKSVAKSR